MTKLKFLWQWMRTGFWFLPSVMALVAAGLAFVAIYIDSSSGEGLPLGVQPLFEAGAEGAREVLSAIASSTITVASVVFSITVVVLALASQQFGPRLLRTFLRDMTNQAAIGMFVSTYIYALIVLRAVGATSGYRFVPHLGVALAVLLALASMAVLIYYIHHVASSIQANSIIAAVRHDLEGIIEGIPEKQEGKDRPKPASDREQSIQVKAQRTGYLQSLDTDRLLQVASDHDLVVYMLVRPGDFISAGDPIAELRRTGDVEQEIVRAVRNSTIIGNTPTLTQDLLYAVQQLVQIAVRALSPGINDPLTAMVCLDALGAGMIRLAERGMPSTSRRDPSGQLRLVLRDVSFHEVIEGAFDMIRHYGRSSPSVLAQLLATLGKVAARVRHPDQREAVRHQIEYTRVLGEQETFQRHEASRMEVEYQKAMLALERSVTSSP